MLDLTNTPKSPYKYMFFDDVFLGVLSNQSVYKSQSLNLLLSSSSRSILASKGHLKVRFCWENREKLLLECRRPSLNPRNEKALIRWAIGSIQALSRVRIPVYLLISFPIKLDLNFKSSISRILDLILVFSLFAFWFSI